MDSVMFCDNSGWEARHQLQRPPALTAEIALRRWRELNFLLHSLALLPGEFGKKNSFLPILRLAGTIVSAQRGLLYLKKGTGGGLRLMIGFGFAGRVPERLRSSNLMAAAAIRWRKPILMNEIPEPALREEIQLLKDPCCLTVPILMRGAPWGAVQLVRSRPFEEEEAILLWIFALILEGALPGSMESARFLHSPASSDLKQGLVDRRQFASRLAWEIERSGWVGRPCSLLRMQWRPAEGEPVADPKLLGSEPVLRVIRRSLRSVDLITSCEGGDLLVALPERDDTEAHAVARDLRRNLIQSRVLGDEPLTSLRVSATAFPLTGGRSEDLLRSVEATLSEPDGWLPAWPAPTSSP